MSREARPGIAIREMSTAQDGRISPVECVMPAQRPFDPTLTDTRLECAMRRMTLTGVLVVLALPIARGDSIWLGALPLWLIGMPLSSWWALHRFRLPRFGPPAVQAMKPRRRIAAQARRWKGTRCPGRIARAA